MVEILIALALFSMTITAVTLVFFSGQNFITDSLQARKAVEKAHDGAEALRFIRDTNFTSMTNGLHGLSFTNDAWQLTTTPDWSEDFKRTVSISTDLDGIKHADLIVQWHHPSEGTKSFNISETIAPPNQGLTGDWTQPRLIGSGDIGPGNQGTDIAYKGDRVYMTATAASAPKPDFFIFDVSNPAAPVLKSGLNIETGLAAVAVQGNYAYVVEDTSPDFFIIDISSDTNPIKIAKLTLQGDKGRSVFTNGNYVYVGTNRSGAEEFFIIDVANPASPTVRSSTNVTGDVAAISALGNIAYLATADSSSEMILYDVSDPNNPVFLSSYDALGSSEKGKSIHAKTVNRIYLGRMLGGNHTNHHEFHVINATNTQLPILLGSKDVPSDINDLFTVSYLTFMATDDPNKEFQIMRINDYNNLTLHGLLNLSQVATGIAYNANVVYLSARSNDALKIITSTY